MVSLRDFLLLFFFVNLGAALNLAVIQDQVLDAVIFSLFVLIGNPLIVLIIMGILGYRKRTSFLAGLTVAQISEFSLIFAGLGLQLGHLTEKVVGLITLVGLITIGLSTYMILYSHNIYSFLAPALRIFEKKTLHNKSLERLNEQRHFDIIIVGMGRFGSNIAQYLDLHELNYLGIDFDPQKVFTLQKEGKSLIYGDLEDPDILERLPYHHSKCIISTIPDFSISLQFAKNLRREGFPGKVLLTLKHQIDYEFSEEFTDVEILLPYHMAAENLFNTFLKDLILKDK